MNNDYARLQRDGWQRVAGKYDDAWAGLTRMFIPDLLDSARIERGQHVLDVACGPGYVAEAALGRGATPRGIDISSEMIRIARERNPVIDLRVGDATALDFDSSQFDAVVSNFGIIHVPDFAAAFAEACRVLRPNGVFAFTVWGGPEASPGARLMDEAIRAHADLNVPIPKGPDSATLVNPDTCRRMLADASFDAESVDVRVVTHGWHVPTASFIFERERDAGVRTAALLSKQTHETLVAIQRDVETRMRAFAGASGFVVPYTAHVIRARPRS